MPGENPMTVLQSIEENVRTEEQRAHGQPEAQESLREVRDKLGRLRRLAELADGPFNVCVWDAVE